jgi:hypothetical protein
MTQQTLNYLLRLAIRERDEHARRMIDQPPDADICVPLGQAMIAVKELLDLSQSSSRVGAARHPRKGFGSMSPERRAELAAKAVAAKRAKTIALRE